MSTTAAPGPGPRGRGRAAVLLVTALALSAPGAAQERAQEPAPQPAQAAAPEQESVSPAEPTKDLFDLLRELRHKPAPPPPGPEDYKKWMVAAAPVLTYGPTSGFGIGLAGNMAVYRGFPGTTRISSIVASVTATTKEQVLVNAKISSSAARQPPALRGRQPPVLDVAEDLRARHRHRGGRRGRPEVRLLPVLRDALPEGRPQHLPGRGAPLQQSPGRPSGRRRGGGGVALLALRPVLGEVRVRPGVADLGRDQPERARRQPRRADQPEPRLARRPHLPRLLRGLPGRRIRAGSN